ncbi:MAG: SDR family NAD(P)-dependent oxidoreductase [Deltaproteobacteria bacterium]|nr:SDR family NAD(P)-dependent oxidoreductase [Deltaproteobacteria bacterium]
MTETALVTGACSGIGLAIAGDLARRGYGLVLVSQRRGPLEDAAQRLRNQYGVAARPLTIDLARPDAAAELEAAVTEDVDVLVNNAGMFFFGEVADADPARAKALLQLHVVTPSLLCASFGRRMRERRRGHILIVSSISAWRDFPGIAFYGASKRYLRSFACSLRSELSVWGVNVTVLAPGATATGLYDDTSINVARAKRLGVMMSPEAVARAGVRAMLKGRAEHIPGFATRLMTYVAARIPQWAIDLVRRRAPWLGRPA